MNKPDYKAIWDFWNKNVENLSNGQMDSRIMEQAYECGSVVQDYSERIEGLDTALIYSGDPEFIATLNRSQLLGCIAYHFRADHFDNWHFAEEDNVLSLQRFIRAWLEKSAD